MRRRQVLQKMAALGGGVLVMSVVGCSKSNAAGDGTGNPQQGAGLDDGGSPVAQCSEGSEGMYLNPGHPHTVITLTAEELAAGKAGIYTLMGGGHSHTFEITAENFETLQNGEEIVVEDLEGHGHELGLACL